MKYHLTYGIRSHEIVYTCTIGRREGDIKFNDESVSGIHARLHIENDKLFLTDLGSSNGTFVNGNKVEPNITVEVFHADLIAVGQQNLTVKLEKPEEEVNHTIMESLEDLEKKRTQIMLAAVVAEEVKTSPNEFNLNEDTNSDDMPVGLAVETHDNTLGDLREMLKVAPEQPKVEPKKNLLFEADPGTIVERLVAPPSSFAINDKTNVELKKENVLDSHSAKMPQAPQHFPPEPVAAKPIEASKAFIRPAAVAVPAPHPSAPSSSPIVSIPIHNQSGSGNSHVNAQLNAPPPPPPPAKGKAIKAGQQSARPQGAPQKKRGLTIGLTLALIMMGAAYMFKDHKKINGSLDETVASREPSQSETQMENSAALIENTPTGDNTTSSPKIVAQEAAPVKETPVQTSSVPAAATTVVAEQPPPLVESPAEVELEKIPEAPPPVKKIAPKKKLKTKKEKELAKKTTEAAPKKTAHKSVPVKTEVPKAGLSKSEPIKFEIPKTEMAKEDVTKGAILDFTSDSTDVVDTIKTQATSKPTVAKAEVSKSEAALLVKLNKLKTEINSSKSPRVKTALEADAIELCTAYYKAQKFAINKEWKESRTLASETRGALKKVLLKEIAAITTREKTVKAKIPSYLKGQLKTPF